MARGLAVDSREFTFAHFFPDAPGTDWAHAASHSSSVSTTISFSADRAAKVVIKKVELLDGMGKYIQDLAPRKLSRWDGSAYVAWDEQLETSKPISASYALAAPNWEKLGGRMQSQAKKYNLHVVVAVDGSEHSLDKESVQPVVMQPDVVTCVLSLHRVGWSWHTRAPREGGEAMIDILLGLFAATMVFACTRHVRALLRRRAVLREMYLAMDEAADRKSRSAPHTPPNTSAACSSDMD